MPVVSVRVSRELKEKMDRLDQDWASYLRRMIERKTREHEVSEASQVIDRIRLRTEEGKYDSARSIRMDRDSG
jgi:predicted DNA-binding protein